MNSNDGWTRVNKQNTTWKPMNPGDSIQGVYVEKRLGIGKNKATVYTLEVNGGSRVDIWDTSAIGLLMNDPENAPKIGEEIKLTYNGTQENSRTGRKFKSFELLKRPVVKGAPETTDEESDDDIPF